MASFPGIKAYLPDAGDATRWDALGMRCRQPHGARSIREVSIRIPQCRLRAVESGLLSEVRTDVARRYSHFLGIEEWVAEWCRSNRELALRVGFLDGTERRPRGRP